MKSSRRNQRKTKARGTDSQTPQSRPTATPRMQPSSSHDSPSEHVDLSTSAFEANFPEIAKRLAEQKKQEQEKQRAAGQELDGQSRADEEATDT